MRLGRSLNSFYRGEDFASEMKLENFFIGYRSFSYILKALTLSPNFSRGQYNEPLPFYFYLIFYFQFYFVLLTKSLARTWTPGTRRREPAPPQSELSLRPSPAGRCSLILPLQPDKAGPVITTTPVLVTESRGLHCTVVSQISDLYSL